MKNDITMAVAIKLADTSLNLTRGADAPLAG